MNQGKLWTVVSPSVGLPMFLAAVAIVSVVIHLALLTHTTWLPGLLQRQGKAAALVGAVAAVRPSGVIAFQSGFVTGDGDGVGAHGPGPFSF